MGAGSIVTLFPHGLGAVVFLGWDWIEAAPIGDRDGGWLEVLALATRVTQPTPPIPAPRLVSPGYAYGWIFQFSFRGYYGKQYLVEGSTNLVDWISFGAAIETQPGQFLFQDVEGKVRAAFFYRVRQEER